MFICQTRRVLMSTLRRSIWQRSLEHYPTGSSRVWYLALAVIATIILYYELYVLSSVVPLVLATFHLSLTNYVYLLVLANLLGAVTAIFGSLSDRIGRSNLIVYGLLVTGLVTIAMAFATNLLAFVILYSLLGFVEGIILVATPALVRDFSPRLGRAAAMGFWTVGPVGGSVLATFVASITLSVNSNNWQSQYLIAGVVGIVVFVICFFGLRELSPGLRDQVMVSLRERGKLEERAHSINVTEATAHPWRQMFTPRIVLSSIGVSVFLLIYFAAVGFFPLYLSTIFQFSLAQANGLVGIFWLVNVVAAIAVGLISDRTIVRKPYMLGGAIATIIVTLLFMSRIGQPTSATLMAIFLSLFGITIATAYVTWMASFTETAESINPALVATGLAIEGAILRIFVVVSTLGLPLVVGNGQGWATWWWICIAGMVIFIPTIFTATGYWSMARARKEVRDLEGATGAVMEPSAG
jgi:MFS family permease